MEVVGESVTNPPASPVTPEAFAESASEEPVSPQLEEPASQMPEVVVYGEKFPEVLAVDTSGTSPSWNFSVTLSSLYDTPERYADAWRVLDANDVELGIRVLGHDHANEQPFTRSATIDIPEGTTTVWVEGRDQANGWSGQRFEVALPTG